MTVTTTDQGLTVITGGDPAAAIKKGMATAASVDAALARYKTAVADAAAAKAAGQQLTSVFADTAAIQEARAEVVAAADAAVAAANQAIINVSSAAEDLDLDAAVANVVANATAAQQAVAALRGTDGLLLPGLVPDLSRQYAPVLTATDGDQRQRLTDYLGAFGALGVRQLVGDFTIAGTVPIPAGQFVDASRATFRQTSSNAATFTLGADATLQGGNLIGKTTDYTPSQNSAPTAIGVRVTGARAAVNSVTFTNHAGAGIYLAPGSAGFRSQNVEVSAPALTIPANDSACFGVYVAADSDHTFTDLHVHHVSIGLISAIAVARLSLRSIRAHDITGQHGIYVQNGTGLNIGSVHAWNINLNAVKLQLAVNSSSDSVGCLITDVVADTCGDCAVTINNTAADLTNAKKIRGLVLSQVAATNCGRGVYLGSVRGGTVTGITASGCTLDAITLVDCQNIEGASWLMDGVGRNGIRFTSATGSVQDRITLTGVRIYNPGGTNVAGNLYGIYHNQGSNITLNGLVVGATHGLMVHSLFMAGASETDQATLTVRNADLSGANGGQDVRLMAGNRRVREWSGNRLAGTVLNFPTAFAIRTGGSGLTSTYIANVIPTADVFRVGDHITNGAPTVGGPKGWLCTVAGGLHGGTWAASTAYPAGAWRRTAAGRVMECTTAGTSGTTEPAAATVGQVITDGTAVWTVRAATSATFVSTGAL